MDKKDDTYHTNSIHPNAFHFTLNKQEFPFTKPTVLLIKHEFTLPTL